MAKNREFKFKVVRTGGRSEKTRNRGSDGTVKGSLSPASATGLLPSTSTRRPPGPRRPVSGVMNARSGPWAPPESFITASTAHLCLPPGGLHSSKGPAPPHPLPQPRTTNCQIEMLICQLEARAKESAVKPGRLELPLGSTWALLDLEHFLI